MTAIAMKGTAPKGQSERDPWVALNASIEAMGERFENHIGYTWTDLRYRAGVGRLLELALKSGQSVWNGDALSIVVDDSTWESGKLTLSIDPGRPKTLGVFGAYGGRDGGLVVRNGPYPYSVWVIGKVKWALVVEVANDLLRQGRISRDEALKLFVYMIPRGGQVV